MSEPIHDGVITFICIWRTTIRIRQQPVLPEFFYFYGKAIKTDNPRNRGFGILGRTRRARPARF